MNAKSQLLCAWAGPIAVVVFFIGFWPLAGFLPPLQPSLSAEAVAEVFKSNAMGIRLGSILILVACALLAVFYAGISVQLKRIEGEFAPMTYAQIIAGTLAVAPFIPAAVVWSAAAYRPEMGAEDVRLLSDVGWLFLFMVTAPFVFQFFAIGIGILSDRKPEPSLPRWLAYFTLWSAILGATGSICSLFYRGPFAWNGLLGFYVPATVFGIWTIVMGIMLMKAIRQQEAGRP